jgi:hypothetical protein
MKMCLELIEQSIAEYLQQLDKMDCKDPRAIRARQLD